METGLATQKPFRLEKASAWISNSVMESGNVRVFVILDWSLRTVSVIRMRRNIWVYRLPVIEVVAQNVREKGSHLNVVVFELFRLGKFYIVCSSSTYQVFDIWNI